MKIGRLFGGKPKQEDAPPPALQSPKQIPSGFIVQKTAEYENLYSITIPDDRRHQLDALAFVVHTINQQHGITASVEKLSYGYLKPEGLWVILALKTDEAQASVPMKLWVEGSGNSRKILLEREGLSKAVDDFMTKEGRETIFFRIAGALAGRKQSARIERLREAYLEQAIAEYTGNSGNPVNDDQQGVGAPDAGVQDADSAKGAARSVSPEQRHRQPPKP